MAKFENKFIIDVIPLTRIPLSRQQFFSYEHSQKLPQGTMVSIPLFRRTLNGIVINSRDDFHRLGNIELKKIGKVLEENFLTEKQIGLARFISDYYFSPIGVVLKFFVPKQVKSRNPQPETRNLIPKKIKLTKEQEQAVKKIVTGYGLQVTGFLLFGPASSGKTEVYIHLIKKIKSKNPDAQFLVLLPEIMLMPQALERYGAHFKPDEIAILHSKITKGEFYQNWQKIKSGEAKIIIGTRIAVFAPFKNLKLIVVDEEQDISFKQWDMNPRYDARKVAQILAEIYQAKIVLGSATPSIETYNNALKGEYKLLKLPKLNIPNTNMEIVDMKKERWVKNFSPLSKRLISEIDWALKNKFQTILFINRQGTSAFSICQSCRNVLRCPACDRALVYDSQGDYRCLHCGYRSSVFVSCPKCKGMIFQNIGVGTQKIEKEIKKLFPAAAVERIDAQTMKQSGRQKNIYEEFTSGKIDILIGTQQAIKGWDLPNVNLVGIIDADNLLSVPDFKTDERAFQNIVQAAGRTARTGKNLPGKVIIQTFNPENFIIKTAAELNYDGFYKHEIGERESLILPPFSQLLKIILRGASAKKTDKETQDLYNKIIKFASSKLKVTEPHEPLISKSRGKFSKQIIIKMEASRQYPKKLIKLLENLGGSWIIDRDPISIT